MKHQKIVSLLMAAVLFALAFCFSLPWAAAGALAEGDLNGDGKVTSADARIALRIAAKLETASSAKKKSGDVNGDGKITSADARKILRVAARLESFTENNGTVSLPYGIRFGMTYDEVVGLLRKNNVHIPAQENRTVLNDIPGVDPSYLQSGTLNDMRNNGYLSYYTNWEPYGIDCRKPCWDFTFNEKGKLYCVDFMKDAGTYLDDRFTGEIIAFYTSFFGSDGTEDPYTEYSHGVCNVWRKGTVSVEFREWKCKIMVGIADDTFASDD